MTRRGTMPGRDALPGLFLAQNPRVYPKAPQTTPTRTATATRSRQIGSRHFRFRHPLRTVPLPWDEGMWTGFCSTSGESGLSWLFASRSLVVCSPSSMMDRSRRRLSRRVESACLSPLVFGTARRGRWRFSGGFVEDRPF
jgi:hypothetical protein